MFNEIMIRLLLELQEAIHQNAINKGVWPELNEGNKNEEDNLEICRGQINFGEKIALCHAELSEALEATRKHHFDQDKHCPTFKNFSIELADTVIRVFDLAGACGIQLGEAILAKIKFNKTRSYKHGKHF